MAPKARFICAALLIGTACPTLLCAASYTVQPGDTLSGIARRQLGDGSRWTEIAERNGLQPPYAIQAGQVIDLPDDAAPPPATHAPPEPARTAAAAPEHDESAPRQSWLRHNRGWLFQIGQWLIVFAIFLRLACWFSLVEASFLQCLVLVALLAVLTIVWWSLSFKIMGLLTPRQWTEILEFLRLGLEDQMLGSLLIAFAAYVVALMISTKIVLGCPWRSVVTVSIGTVLISLTVYVTTTLVMGSLA